MCNYCILTAKTDLGDIGTRRAVGGSPTEAGKFVVASAACVLLAVPSVDVSSVSVCRLAVQTKLIMKVD